MAVRLLICRFLRLVGHGRNYLELKRFTFCLLLAVVAVVQVVAVRLVLFGVVAVVVRQETYRNLHLRLPL